MWLALVTLVVNIGFTATPLALPWARDPTTGTGYFYLYQSQEETPGWWEAMQFASAFALGFAVLAAVFAVAAIVAESSRCWTTATICSLATAISQLVSFCLFITHHDPDKDPDSKLYNYDYWMGFAFALTSAILAVMGFIFGLLASAQQAVLDQQSQAAGEYGTYYQFSPRLSHATKRRGSSYGVERPEASAFHELFDGETPYNRDKMNRY